MYRLCLVFVQPCQDYGKCLSSMSRHCPVSVKSLKQLNRYWTLNSRIRPGFICGITISTKWKFIWTWGIIFEKERIYIPDIELEYGLGAQFFLEKERICIPDIELEIYLLREWKLLLHTSSWPLLLRFWQICPHAVLQYNSSLVNLLAGSVHKFWVSTMAHSGHIPLMDQWWYVCPYFAPHSILSLPLSGLEWLFENMVIPERTSDDPWWPVLLCVHIPCNWDRKIKQPLIK